MDQQPHSGEQDRASRDGLAALAAVILAAALIVMAINHFV